MKIGLLTYFWENNAGQYWQAVATLTCLKKRFPDADIELVDVRHWKNAREGSAPRRDWIKPWRITRGRRFAAAYAAGRKRFFTLSDSHFLSSDYEETNQFVKSKDYDLLVIGADVVLKPLPESRVIGNVPIYWLSPKIKAKKAILGSSADTTKCSTLGSRVAERMKMSLYGFEFIAVRDRMTKELLDTLGTARVPIQTIPDPTFCIDPVQSWKDEARRLFPKRKKGCKLAALHLPKSSLVPSIVSSLKHMGFETLSTTREIPGTRWCGSLTPEAWAGMSSAVDIVVTVSFHESIFAMKQGRPVLAVDLMQNRFDPDTYLSKTKCLMKEFGLDKTNHFNPFECNDGSDNIASKIESALNIPVDETIKKCNELKKEYTLKLDHLASRFE